MTNGTTVSVQETLKRITKRVTHQENLVLSPGSTFKQIGADSVDVVQIMVALEDELEIELVDEELKNIKDMSGFIEYLQQKVAAQKSKRHRLKEHGRKGP